MKNTAMDHSPVLRALARLLAYPDAALREDLPAVAELLDATRLLRRTNRAALVALVSELQQAEPLAAEARYVDTFDHGRRTSLHLFEHVHGDSRDRGPAMIDLQRTYAERGLYLAEGELPDHLAVVLEFASTLEPDTAREFLAEMADILNALHAALVSRQSSHAAVIAAAIELAGQRLQAVSLVADEGRDATLDASWAEPEAFGGCSNAGQGRPGRSQPIHIVRQKVAPDTTPRPGAAA